MNENSKSSVLYIPGLEHNWETSPLDEHRFIPSINRLYHPEIESHHVNWGNKENPRNIPEMTQLYKGEAEYAVHDKTVASIEQLIQEKQPKLIVTHSLGSRALYNAVMKGLNLDTPTKILMLQPDIPTSYDFDAFYQKIENQNVDISYTYAPWDNLLALATIYDQELRMGQVDIKKTHFNPRLLPLQIKWNQHTHNNPLYDPAIEHMIQNEILNK